MAVYCRSDVNQMASALVIQVSVVTEMFLDLSLPVSDEVRPHSHVLYSYAFVCIVSLTYFNYM